MTSPPEPQHHIAAPGQGSASDPSPHWLPIGSIEPCPIQPRVTISIDLVAELARSIVEGRHEPVVEVEPIADRPDRYQLVCGEQRWRAARQAGRTRILALVSEPLSHRERLRKQVEEN